MPTPNPSRGIDAALPRWPTRALRDAFEDTSATMVHLDGMAHALDLAWDAMSGLDQRSPEIRAMCALVRATVQAAQAADLTHRAEWQHIIAAEGLPKV